MNTMPRGSLRNESIDLSAHHFIALACRLFESQPINLNQAAPFASNCTGLSELVQNQSRSGTPHPQQLGQNLLRQRYDISTNAIMDVE